MNVLSFVHCRFRGHVTRIIALLAVMIFVGCATQSVPVFQEAFVPARHHYIRVEPCRDRSGFKGERGLAAEATEGLKEKLAATQVFEVNTEGSLVLACDIETFVEGSAFQRWVLPGWGATEAKVAVVIFEKPGDKVLATLRSQSSVGSGGLFSIGADQYILSVALNDIVKQMEAWAKGSKSQERN
jgi:hypothetical protein